MNKYVKYFIVMSLMCNVSSIKNAIAQNSDGITKENKKIIKKINRQILCPVCNGQSISDSFVKQSSELKQKITDLVKLNKNENEIFYKIKTEHSLKILTAIKFNSVIIFLFSIFWLMLIYLFFLRKKQINFKTKNIF